MAYIRTEVKPILFYNGVFYVEHFNKSYKIALTIKNLVLIIQNEKIDLENFDFHSDCELELKNHKIFLFENEKNVGYFYLDDLSEKFFEMNLFKVEIERI